jgi:hypothetical protein
LTLWEGGGADPRKMVTALPRSVFTAPRLDGFQSDTSLTTGELIVTTHTPAALAFAVLLVSPAMAQDVTCNRIGQFDYCSNGTTYNHIGQFTYGSDGTSYNHVGQFSYGSDGTSYNHIGQFTYGSDGSTCNRIGQFNYCNK